MLSKCRTEVLHTRQEPRGIVGGIDAASLRRYNEDWIFPKLLGLGNPIRLFQPILERSNGSHARRGLARLVWRYGSKLVVIAGDEECDHEQDAKDQRQERYVMLDRQQAQMNHNACHARSK